MLLRFRDLDRYGVKNWVTLARWVKEEGFPPGFYLASNSRAWHKEDCDRWLANRPSAVPPENKSARTVKKNGLRFTLNRGKDKFQKA